MSYKKEDFILMTSYEGGDVLINLAQVKYVIPIAKGCRLYFSEEDYVTVKATVTELKEIL